MVAIRNRRIVKRIETFRGPSVFISFRCESVDVNALTSAAVWKIFRDVDLGGGRLETTVASTGLFDQICDDRETLFPPAPFINIFSTLFDGVSGEARSPDGTTLSFENTQPFTMSSWVKPLTSAVMSIIDKQQSPTTFRGYAFLLNAARPQVVIRNDNIADKIVVLANGAIALNDFTHIVATYDGSLDANNVQIYVNGGPVGSTIIDNALTGTIINTDRFRLGRRSGASIPFNGNIDETSIFFKEFTALEVAELFNAGAPFDLLTHSQSSFLRGWWQMGDRQLFPALPDNSTQGNDLSIINLPASAFVTDPASVP